MPSFYFDINDGATMVRDEEGLELADKLTLRAEAVQTITDIARDRMRNSLESDQVVMRVRDRDSRTIMVLSLVLTITEDAGMKDDRLMRPLRRGRLNKT